MPALMGVEMPLVPVLAGMEAVGIAVNPDTLERHKVRTAHMKLGPHMAGQSAQERSVN